MDAVQNRTMNYVCEPYGKMSSGGLILGRDFSKSTLSLLLFQLGLVNSLTALLKICLNPFLHFTFIPEMLSGIAMGPSALSRNWEFKESLIVPLRGSTMITAFDNLAFIFLYFLLTVQVDFVSIVKNSRKLAVAIGFSSFFLPIVLTVPLTLFVKHRMPNLDLQRSLPTIAFLETISTFHTVLIFLGDFNLLNSELGRTAICSSLISSSCSVLCGILAIGLKADTSTSIKRQAILYTHLSRIAIIAVIVFVFRPIMLWMMRKTPEKKSLKEKYICIIIIMIIGSSLLGECTGQHAFFGPVVLGLATPNSPPMGSSLTDKLGCFVWMVLMPAYAINVGKLVNIFDIGFHNFIVVNIFAVLGTLGRLLGSMIPSILYYKMPLVDAFPLGLILSCRGVFDVMFFYRAQNGEFISNETFSTMILTTVFHSTIISPIFRAIYDTSRRYMAYDRRTIQHIRRYTELQIVVCIHEPENVPSMMNILEISNPIKESPMDVYVINLEELVGRLVPLFISHKYSSAPSAQPTRASDIINYFCHYEVQEKGRVRVQCFTALASYTTMHDYVCTLANDKSTTLIIIPFQKTDSLHIRAMNKKVFESAPCSVAIFFGRGTLIEPKFLYSHCIISVCVIFLGGPDDREALAYGACMVENPCVRLTVVRLVDVNQLCGELEETVYDVNAINNFRTNVCKNKDAAYKETNLAEVSDTAKALQCLETDFDLLVVGRRHDNESPLLKELSEWIEIEELGVVGDVFVSSDVSRASVLVVQQQALVVTEMLDTPKRN